MLGVQQMHLDGQLALYVVVKATEKFDEKSLPEDLRKSKVGERSQLCVILMQLYMSSFVFIFAEARRAARFVALPQTPHVVLLAQHAPLGVQRGRRHHARHCGK